MLVPPLATRESTACSDCCCLKAVIFRSGNSLQADGEKATTERRSLGHCFRSRTSWHTSGAQAWGQTCSR
jgi:hypothetical protein